MGGGGGGASCRELPPLPSRRGLPRVLLSRAGLLAVAAAALASWALRPALVMGAAGPRSRGSCVWASEGILGRRHTSQGITHHCHDFN